MKHAVQTKNPSLLALNISFAYIATFAITGLVCYGYYRSVIGNRKSHPIRDSKELREEGMEILKSKEEESSAKK
jgi:hypothetical protein